MDPGTLVCLLGGPSLSVVLSSVISADLFPGLTTTLPSMVPPLGRTTPVPFHVMTSHSALSTATPSTEALTSIFP